MAVGSALYYTIAVGSLTTDALLLGMAAVATLSIRQLLAKIDVRRYAEEAADGEKYLRSIVAGSSDFITVLDARRRVRWQAFSAEWRPGSADRDLTGVEFADWFTPDDAAEVNRQLADVLSEAAIVGTYRWMPDLRCGRGSGVIPSRRSRISVRCRRSVVWWCTPETSAKGVRWNANWPNWLMWTV